MEFNNLIKIENEIGNNTKNNNDDNNKEPMIKIYSLKFFI